MRGLAAQMVLIGHTLDFYLTEKPAWMDTYQLQEFGVVIFFVLSGYLIAYSSDRQHQHGHASFYNYLKSRAVRIYATLIPALLLIAMLDALFSKTFTQDFFTDNSVFIWLVNLLHLQEYPYTQWRFYGTGYPLWSLAVEWWLYMGFGVLVFTDARRRWYGWLLLLLATGSLLYNSVAGNAPGIVYAWLFGALGYWLSKPGQPSNRNKIKLGLFTSIILLGWIIAAPRAFSHAYHPLAMFGIGVIVLAGLWLLRHSHATHNGMMNKLIHTAADSSFSLYLLHFSILAAGYVWYGAMADFWLILIALLVCNLTAVLFARWFEWHWNSARGFYRNNKKKP